MLEANEDPLPLTIHIYLMSFNGPICIEDEAHVMTQITSTHVWSGGPQMIMMDRYLIKSKDLT